MNTKKLKRRNEQNDVGNLLAPLLARRVAGIVGGLHGLCCDYEFTGTTCTSTLSKAHASPCLHVFRHRICNVLLL